MNWFLTGTDTGVGKTHVAQLLIKAGRRAGLGTVGFKPFCCGDRRDALALHLAADRSLPLDLVNPVWMRPPAAPYAGAIIEDRLPDLDLVRTSFHRIRSAHRSVIVEGVGGWLVPVLRDFSMADLAVEFGLPVVMVVHNRLGALNHALLTLESIRSHGLECAGFILNHMEEDAGSIPQTTNRAILEEIGKIPVLFDISPGQTSLELGAG